MVKIHPGHINVRQMSRIDPEKVHPYLTTRFLGWHTLRHPGEHFLPELVISGFLRSMTRDGATKRAHYDHPTAEIGLRRNVFIIADRDSKKGSIMSMWRKRIMGMRHYMRDDETGFHSYAQASGGTTYESLRGGAGNDGKLDMPDFPRIDFLLVPEAMSWYGHDPRRRAALVDQLNHAIEDGDMDVNLTKMKSSSAKDRQEFAARCEPYGIYFDIENAALTYTFNTTLIQASRTPDEKTWSHMLVSGFLSRNALVEWDPDPEEYREYKLNQIADENPDVERCIDFLRDFMQRAASIRWLEVPYPPMPLVNQAMARTQVHYDMLMEQTSVPQSVFEISRELQYFAQLMTFNAGCRMMRNNPTATKFDTIQYESEDVDFAVNHFIQYVLPIVERRAQKSIQEGAGASKIDEALPILHDFLIEKADEDHELGNHSRGAIAYSEFGGGDFYRFYCTKKKLTNPTFQTRLAELIEKGYIKPVGTRGRERIYRVLESYVRSDLNLKTISDEMAELDALDARREAYA